jgi:hypothetical protein
LIHVHFSTMVLKYLAIIPAVVACVQAFTFTVSYTSITERRHHC